MSKSEEYSFNIPSELFQQLTKEQQVLWRKEIENTFNNGYNQAEKDLELTIDDVEKIHTFLYAIKNNKNGVFTFTRLPDERYQEVLKRFKDFKEKEIEMTIQQHAERISNWNGYTQTHQTEYDCCMEMGYAVLKEIESVLPCVVKDGIIYDKIKDKIKELRNEL